MAAEEEADGDAPIAAFAVSKGGVVIKHIFLHAPPSSPVNGDEEDPPVTVTVGRHPDCHVVVDHTSVSRFHLQLRARRRQRRITVTDLRSLYGTWVSGQRIPPPTPVDLAAGDTLWIGASKREYRLLWLLLREALEMDDAPYMPPLSEDKEEPHAYQEASSQLVAPEQRESADMKANQTSQQIILEDIAFRTKVIPSAPPLPDFAQSFSVDESYENSEGVIEDMSVDQNPTSEPFGSLIIKEMPAALTNAGRPAQSDKQDTSNQVSKRSRDRNNALSYISQKGDQNEIIVCSESCGVECTACIALFGIFEFERGEEKEEMVAEDQEAFCSDKENITPQSSTVRKTRDVPENRARVESAITKKRVADSSFDCKCTASELAIKLEDKLSNIPNQESGRAGRGMKAWTMVANTDYPLDDESRKSIMLLRGIKGTPLFVPRIVIRELDSTKQGLFRRSTKAISILQWIKEYMATESWWIHVQSSSEMFPAALTPPATPSAQRIDEEIKAGSAGFFNPMAALFSPRSFELADIVSPKPEDRILDCALLLNKLRSDQNVVILSNSVALKIKAMAEGMLCEGAKEFRESLMNPCWIRFMWATSAPLGRGWSRLDAAALAEDYYNSHHHHHEAKQQQRRPAEAAAMGLKLILRHNSLYAQATDAAARKTPLVSLASV